MKKFFKNILKIFPIFSLFFVMQAGEVFANSCVIQNGPVQELNNYPNFVRTEVGKIISDSMARNPNCTPNTRLKISAFFDAASAELQAFHYVHTDALYNLQVSFRSDTKPQIREHIKIFDTVEKNIADILTSRNNICLDDSAKAQIKSLIKDNYELKRMYQNTTLWNTVTNFSTLNFSENISVANAVSAAYNPNSTVQCQNNNKQETDFLETLKKSLQISGKMDDALSTWRKALDMLRGGGSTMSASEVTARQRQLLQAELSRQWLSQNAKNTILKNFDCYQEKISHANGNAENILEARANCLQVPLTGVENLYNEWNKFVWKSEDSITFTQRNKIQNTRKTRSINIEQMHDILANLTAFDESENDSFQKWLIDLHINIQLTNKILEQRITPMQKNCMKWQPDISGGCK